MTQMHMPGLGDRIKAARERSGLSHDRLGALVGTSRQHLIRLEKGVHTPKPEMLARIAEALDCKVEELNPDDEDEESDRVANMTLDQFLESRVRKLLRKIQGEDGFLRWPLPIRSRLNPVIHAWVA